MEEKSIKDLEIEEMDIDIATPLFFKIGIKKQNLQMTDDDIRDLENAITEYLKSRSEIICCFESLPSKYDELREQRNKLNREISTLKKATLNK